MLKIIFSKCFVAIPANTTGAKKFSLTQKLPNPTPQKLNGLSLIPSYLTMFLKGQFVKAHV